MALLSKKNTFSVPCLVGKWAVALLLFVVAVCALVGVYETHVIVSSEPTTVSLQFGSTGGSLAIIAFTMATMAWCKKMMCCMSKTCEVCSK